MAGIWRREGRNIGYNSISSASGSQILKEETRMNADYVRNMKKPLTT
jgi:hypothetical protein